MLDKIQRIIELVAAGDGKKDLASALWDQYAKDAEDWMRVYAPHIYAMFRKKTFPHNFIRYVSLACRDVNSWVNFGINGSWMFPECCDGMKDLVGNLTIDDCAIIDTFLTLRVRNKRVLFADFMRGINISSINIKCEELRLYNCYIPAGSAPCLVPFEEVKIDNPRHNNRFSPKNIEACFPNAKSIICVN